MYAMGVRPGVSEVGSNCSTMVWLGGEMEVQSEGYWRLKDNDGGMRS